MTHFVRSVRYPMLKLYLAIMSLFITVSLLAASAQAAKPESSGKPAKELRVAAVQMRSTRDLDANVRKIQKYLERCAHDGARVVVFPECALTGYFDNAYMRGLSAESL